MPILDEKRVFLALNLPKEVKENLGMTLDKLKKSVDYVKWVDLESLHITLHFLGNLRIDSIDKLISALEKNEEKYNGEMTFKLGNLNAFPSIYNSRVIFIETKQQSGTNVFKLHKETLDEIIRLSLDFDLRKWFPHITLGRVKSKINSDIFQRTIIEPQFFSIKSFELMESVLHSSGSEYKILKSFKF